MFSRTSKRSTQPNCVNLTPEHLRSAAGAEARTEQRRAGAGKLLLYLQTSSFSSKTSLYSYNTSSSQPHSILVGQRSHPVRGAAFRNQLSELALKKPLSSGLNRAPFFPPGGCTTPRCAGFWRALTRRLETVNHGRPVTTYADHLRSSSVEIVARSCQSCLSTEYCFLGSLPLMCALICTHGMGFKTRLRQRTFHVNT